MPFSWFRKKKQPPADAPAYWMEYLALWEDPLDKDLPIEEVRFIVFDTETTGLNPKTDHILSIGAVELRGHRICLDRSFECYLQQVRAPEKDSIKIHGILPRDLHWGQSEAEAMEAFVQYIGRGVLVGHNVFFDQAILNRTLAQQVGDTLKNPVVDTHQLALRLEHIFVPQFYRRDEYTLDALCRRFQIPLNDRHTAAGDAYITAVLLVKMLSRLRGRGITTLQKLLR